MANFDTWFPGLFGLLFGLEKPMWRKILHPVLNINDDTDDDTLKQKILISSLTSLTSSKTSGIATNAHALAPPIHYSRRRT
jgi:hypothetical protein